MHLYVAGTVGTVLVREVSLFQRYFCTHLYVIETVGTVHISEVYSLYTSPWALGSK